MTHIITKELIRQKEQGYYESKKGTISPYFSFEIKLKSQDQFIRDEVGIIKIQKGDISSSSDKGIIYRLQHACYDLDGKGLLNFPSTDYTPIHKVFNDISEIIGKNGKASYSICKDTESDDGPGWSWCEKDANSLEEALEKYRFAWLNYESPNGTILRFSSGSPDKNMGKLRAIFSLSKLEQNSKMGYFDTRVEDVANYFDKLEIK